MGSLFPQHERDTAPPESRELLDEVEAEFGLLPNLERTLASAPAALAGYVKLGALFEQTSFTPVEREVVCQTSNFLHGCTY